MKFGFKSYDTIFDFVVVLRTTCRLKRETIIRTQKYINKLMAHHLPPSLILLRILIEANTVVNKKMNDMSTRTVPYPAKSKKLSLCNR